MSEINRLSNRNAAIQDMLTDGNKIINFYRFVAQNPHISLHDACQIVIDRPNASVCFSMEEWNAMDRRVTRGKRGIAYYEADGNKRYVFDANDTHGDTRYKRLVYPIKRLLQGLDALNGTDKYSDFRGDYRKIHDGVATYLQENGYFTDDEERNRLILEGTTYSLYCKTGFPKSNGIVLHGMTGDLTDNSQLFKDICNFTNFLYQEIEEAYVQAQNGVQVINDVDEETVSDEPIVAEQPKVEQTVDEPQVTPYYKEYLDAQKKYPDSIILIRLGDFYEMMGECAKTASNELDLTLTGRNVGLPERVPMCGIPYHATDKYIEKLLKNHSVVVVEGEEEPKYIQSYVEKLEQSEEAEIDYDESEDEEEDWDSADDEQDMPIEEDTERPQEKTKQQKRIKDRKRKNSSQMSIFDMIGEQPDIDEEENKRETFIKSLLQYGSGVQYGKFRIAEKYKSNPTTDAFAAMLRKEYGSGGRGTSGLDEMHDSKGIRAKYEDKENPQNNIAVNLKWNEVATRIADLIDDGEYFTANEKESFEDYLAERTGSEDERNNAIANNIIKRLWNKQDDGYFRMFGSYCYAGYGYVQDHSDEIVEILKSKSDIDDAYFRSGDFYLYGKELKSAKERLREQDSPQNKIKAIVDRIIEEGTQNTTEGNWITCFSEFGAEEKFVKEHKDEIADEIESREEVSDVILDGDSFDVNYYTDYTFNLSEDEEEVVEQPASTENTDLNAIGFDQNELGGDKARFKGNLEAIRLLNRLERENRNPTADEQKILAKYVGWGGLAKAFDEHDENWRSQYCELISTLNSEDYEKAKGSVLNAHYTSKTVIDGIYKALSRFGVKGNNRILEPSMGTGNFFGYMPKDIQENARLYGVELDNITGKIATKLYPKANIQVKGFEQTTFPNDHFDIVVGNVPFGVYTVYDSDYAKQNFYIHDYFLAKSIDKLKPNGLMAVITSSGTMDKLNPTARKYLAERAELIGAIRLPNDAFQKTAGTQVVADILFFKKREQRAYVDTDNTEWLSTGKTEQGYEINNYFIQHPEMVLGEFVKEHGMYGAIDVTVKSDGRNLAVALEEAVSHLPENFYTNPEYSESAEEEKTTVDYNVRPLCYKAQNGRLYMRVGESMVEQEIPSRPADAYDRICAMIDLRNELRYVLEIQTEGCTDEKLIAEQKTLNENYDRFVKRYGILNSQTNTRLFKEDGDSALLFACENVAEDKKTVTKADVFSKRTIRPYVSVTLTDDCFEALQICKNERGNVDISYIEEITKKDYDTVLFELGDAVFRNPVMVNPDDKYTGFETAEEYLSGKVVRKLEVAEEYAKTYPNDGYEKNVEALKSVQPKAIKAGDIAVRLGASWVDESYYKQFIRELLDLPAYYPEGIQVYYNPHDSSWRVDRAMYMRGYSYLNVNKVYGTERAHAYRLIEDCLNLKATTIYDTVDDGEGTRRVLNKAETIAAREKQISIKEAFKDWIFRDPERREELEKEYNAKFNQIKLPTYDGSYLRFPEMNPAIELKPHQKNAVHRIITGGNTLLHHVVGSGKTFTICAAIMKLRQYGLAKKPMIAVPNHLVEQWASQFRSLYPNANLLIASKDDLDKNNRQKFVSRVAMGDWDAVIIAQSSFAKIPISSERQIRKIKEEIERIEETISSTWMEQGMPRGAVKNLERIKKNREAQLKKLLDDSKKDGVLIFENLGVDYLFVDEAHYYKNKFLFTKMNNVAGISTTASQRASDLELKCEYINELHYGDKGVVFATGTPISNSMTEMYTMQSYLQQRTLQELGITYFDNWAADFGETVTSLEMTPSGQGYKPKTRFARFTNLPELLTLYRSFADVQTSDMVKLEVPDVDRKVITLKPSDEVLALADEIADRAEQISLGSVAPEIDNMLKVTSDGKKLALDPRCYERSAEDEKGSKLEVCADNIREIWEETQDTKSTQIVFCDLSTPKCAYEDYVYGRDFDVYNDLKYKLIERGIPSEEIAFIHDANTDKQKQALFDGVNAGTVRVLIGSTEKCGAGTNVQERLIALHHLDTPYRPSDMQQREGRIIRQGNTNKEVKIFTYVKERTFDSYSYQILENKQRFISQIDRGDLTVREADDIDETTLSYAEIKAITAANPKIKRKMEVDTEVARLRVLEGQYKKNMYNLQDKIRKKYPEDINRQTLYLERLREDIRIVKEMYNSNPEQFSISVMGKIYTDRKEGGLALLNALHANHNDVVVAEYAGFKISLNPMIMLTYERSVTLAGTGRYEMNIGESASGLLTRLDNFCKEFPEREERAENRLNQLKNDLAVAEEEIKKPFEYADQLATLVKEQSELNIELDVNKREEVVMEDGKEENIVSDDENGMALPEQKVTTQKRKKKRSTLNESSAKTYIQQQEKHPKDFVFIRNGDDYEIYGDRAVELSEKYDLPLIEDTLLDESKQVASVSLDMFDLVVRNIVNNGGKTAIIEQISDRKEETFIDNEDKIATMEVAVLPDYTVDQERMHELGYTWDGMLPLRKNTAKMLINLGLPIVALNNNDTETKISTVEEADSHSGIFGIEKPDWNEFINSDKGKSYLTARHLFTESMKDVLDKEMDYFDGSFVDGLADINYEERVAIDGFLKENGKATETEAIKPYVPALLEHFTDKFRGMPLGEYGWEIQDVRDALAEHISNEEIKNYASELSKEKKLHAKIDYHLKEFKWLNGRTEDFTEDEIDDIVNDLKPDFEDDKYFNDSSEEYPFDLWYDDYSEDHIRPYLETKAIKEQPKAMSLDERVRECVEAEYAKFYAEEVKKTPEELITQDSYKIRFYNEMSVFLSEESKDNLTDRDKQALLEDTPCILINLYEEFLGDEYASINNYEDDANFVMAYNDRYHKEIVSDRYDWNEGDFDNKVASYYGKDTSNTAYYYLPKLSLETLPEITEKADTYVVTAPLSTLSDETAQKYNIFFLKTERDISVNDIKDKSIAIGNMQNAVHKVVSAKNEEYRKNLQKHSECMHAITVAIADNFDGMNLKAGFEDDIIDKYGLDEVAYVLSNTVQYKNDDGRFSKENKDWAKQTDINEIEGHRYQFVSEAHPAVLNGFVDRIRRKQKELSSENMLQGEFLNNTKHGYSVVNIMKDVDDRNIAIIFRKSMNDYIVAARYDTTDGQWAQGEYVSTREIAEQVRAERYGDRPIIYENKEWSNMPEKEKQNWIEVIVSQDAVIKKYDKSSFMRMPTSGMYSGFTYNIFNDRIKRTTQLADFQSDSRELALKIRLKENEVILLYDRDTEEEKQLTASEFKSVVHGTLDKDYVRKTDKNDKMWTTISVPREAIRGEYEKSVLFAMPKTSEIAGYSFYVPTVFVREDEESEGDRIKISVPDDFKFTAKNKDTDEKVELSAYQVYKRMDGTADTDYITERKIEQPTAQSAEQETAQQTESTKRENNGWRYVSVDESTKLVEYNERTLFRMPNGEYDGYCYYIPNSLLKANEEKGTIRISLPDGFVVTAINRQAEKAEEQKVEMNAEVFIVQVKGKTEEDYTKYSKPSETTSEKFTAVEKQLIERVPEEMKNKPNWVIVRIKPNEEKGRLDKFLIDIHTGKMAKSDDPSTWATFDEAREYAKKNGGVALAYALDGKDGIACIDLDDCFEENGDMTPFAKSLYDKCDGMYCERSVSGKGLHFFGKTKGMDVRTFSKDGEMEFYREAHFIAMTGDDFGGTKLKSFDEPQIKSIIESKCAKRTPLSGTGAGVEGLSRMSDRDVVERASNGKDGERFRALYGGEDIKNDHSRSDMSLMNALAFWCNGDKEQMLRIFATSGLYRPEKSDNYYEGTVIKAIRDTVTRYQPKTQMTTQNKPKSNSDKGGK